MAEEVKDEVEEKKIKSGAPAEEKPLDKMTAPELREIAKELPGVAGVHAMKKAELLEIIKAARGIKEEKPSKKKKLKTEPTWTKSEIKKKILVLRKEKEAAREGRNRHQVDILRRQIKRLKRQTRRIAQS